MSYVELYTITRSQVQANIGDYVSLTRYPARPNTSIVPVYGTGYADIRMAEIPETKVACKVYRLSETGKPERLVAIDPELVDTIQFVALDKVKAQLADEKFRVKVLTDKLHANEHLLDKEKSNSATYELRYNKLLSDTETIPVWKFVWTRLVNWYTK